MNGRRNFLKALSVAPLALPATSSLAAVRPKLSDMSEARQPRIVAVGDMHVQNGEVWNTAFGINSFAVGGMGWVKRLHHFVNYDVWLDFGSRTGSKIAGANLGQGRAGWQDLLTNANSRLSLAFLQDVEAVYISLGSDDITVYARTSAEIIADATMACRIFTRAGIKVFLADVRPWAVTGGLGYPADSPFRTTRAEVNLGYKNLWETEPLVFEVNLSKALADDQGLMKTEFTSDGQQLSDAGGFAEGKVIAIALRKSKIDLVKYTPNTRINNYLPGYDMASQQGSVGVGCSGAVATGFSIERTVGQSSASTSIVDDPDSQNGRAQLISITPVSNDSYANFCFNQAHINLTSLAGVGTWVYPYVRLVALNKTNIDDAYRYITAGIQDFSMDGVPSHGPTSLLMGLGDNHSQMNIGQPFEVSAKHVDANFLINFGVKGTGRTSGTIDFKIYEMGIMKRELVPFQDRNLPPPLYS